MVLVIGVLGNGLFGAGMRAAQERETNILRRYKVTPISPAPLLLASMVTGWLIYLPAVVILVLFLAHFLYGHADSEAVAVAVGALITLGVVAFRAIGLIIASVANSMPGINLLSSSLYMPMLFLSGATIPVTALPEWAQIAGQFLPAAYLVTGFQGIFLRNETLAQNAPSLAAMLMTIILTTFICMQIFRLWWKD